LEPVEGKVFFFISC